MRSVERGRAGDEPAERAERLRQGADAERVDAGEVGIGAEDGVGLVEHEERAVSRAHVGQLVDRRDVAVHREDGVGDDDRVPAAGARSRSNASTCSRSAWRYTATSARDRRQPSMIDAWLSASEQIERVGPAERGEHAEVRGEPGGEEHGRVRCASTSASAASSSEWTGREPTMSRAEPDPAPHRSSAACAAATTAGCCVSPR